MNVTSLDSPPPGLEFSNNMMPLKVGVPDLSPPPGVELLPHCHDSVDSGEWVNVVASIVPYLTQEGALRALSILDRAIANAQQAKLLQSTLEKMPCVVPGSGLHVAAEQMRMQFEMNQQSLLDELRHVGSDFGMQIAMGQITTGFPFEACMSAGGQAATAPVNPTIVESPADIINASGSCSPSNKRPGMPKRGAADSSGAGSDHPHKVLSNAASGVDNTRNVRTTTVDCEAPITPAASRKSRPTHDKRRADPQESQTLSSSLQLLSVEDPDCLLIVRRINKLGFKAGKILKKHFSHYGPVVRVLVAHSTMRQHGEPQAPTRRRPSSLGFVQMSASEAVQQILARGNEQEVDGSFIRVQRFERKDVAEPGDAAAADDGDEYGDAYEAVDSEGCDNGAAFAAGAQAERMAKEIQYVGGTDSMEMTKEFDWCRGLSTVSNMSTATRSTCASLSSVESHTPANTIDSEASS